MGFTELTPILFLIPTFLSLIYFLRKYYRYDYEQNKALMFYFFFFEMSTLALLFTFRFKCFMYNEEIAKDILPVTIKIIDILIAFGIYPLLSAVGLIYVKAIEDPLVGISKLEYL